MEVKIEPSWHQFIKEEFTKEYFIDLVKAIKKEVNDGFIIYPRGREIFNAFNLTPVDKVKVVIIGQDPYHGLGQAHGLSFSVPDGVPPPPSLINIFKELKADIGVEFPHSGNLERWANQGVFLLNSILTVRAGEAASHRGIGWEQFTDNIISKLSAEKKGLIFLLWGNYAKKKGSLIDQNRHFVLDAPHPSPLARGAFFGCRHFSKSNELLIKLGKEPIIW